MSKGWVFPVAHVVEVHDGDTVTVDIEMDAGFHDSLVRRRPMRLLGINTRELDEPGGPEAQEALAALLPVGTVVSLTSVKNDKYGGRYVAKLTLPDGRDVAEVMIAERWAAKWNGTGKKPVPPWPRNSEAPAVPGAGAS
jgi:endonuclease YncB( thermonuclease family)